MKIDGQEGIAKRFLSMLPFFAAAVVIKLLENKVAWLSSWGLAITVGIAILIAYLIYKNDCKKEVAEAK